MIPPTKLSPIHHTAEKWQGQFVEQAGWQIVQMYSSVENETAVIQNSVGLCDLSHHGKIRIEGQTAAQLLQAEDLAIHSSNQIDDGDLFRLRSDLFLLRTKPEIVEDVTAVWSTKANDSDDLITITDISHGNAELWLVGPHSAELLSRLCGLDFHDSQFPNGTAKQSSVAKTSQLIIRQDLGKHLAFGLIGPRSLGVYLWQTIMKAGHNLGIEPVGQLAFEQHA